VRKAFDGKIPLIVDGGPSQVGLESTVLDLTAMPPAVLRPGMIHAESLLAVMGEKELGLSAFDRATGPETKLRSPGMLRKHYSPRAKLVILSWRDQADLTSQLQPLPFRPEKTCVIAHSQIRLSDKFARVAILPHDAEAYARALYAELHQCDESGAALVVVEAPPPQEAWRAIADRLFRAAQ
jgi:L-threonylcarbamoyladenylate synthase